MTDLNLGGDIPRAAAGTIDVDSAARSLTYSDVNVEPLSCLYPLDRRPPLDFTGAMTRQGLRIEKDMYVCVSLNIVSLTCLQGNKWEVSHIDPTLLHGSSSAGQKHRYLMEPNVAPVDRKSVV